MRRSSPLLLRAAMIGLAALALPACVSQRNHIQPGAYTAKAPPGAGVQLNIDAGKREVTFTSPGVAPQKRSSTVWDDAKWPTLCPRGLHDTASEVIDLGAEPLQLGSIRVEHPLLVANCVGKPIVDLMSIGSDGSPKRPAAAEFER